MVCCHGVSQQAMGDVCETGLKLSFANKFMEDQLQLTVGCIPLWTIQIVRKCMHAGTKYPNFRFIYRNKVLFKNNHNLHRL